MMNQNQATVTATPLMMGVTSDLISPSVMDDPRTPLFTVCNSLDQEFQVQDNSSTLQMLRHKVTTNDLKTVSYSDQPSASDDEIALPADLFYILEDIPFNFDELAHENIYNDLPPPFDSDYEQRAINTVNAGLANTVDQLETPTFEETPLGLLQVVEDNIIMDLEEVEENTFSSSAFLPAPDSEVSSPSISPQPVGTAALSLDLTIQPTIGHDLTTPILIKMLLDDGDTTPVNKELPASGSFDSDTEGPPTPSVSRRSVSRNSNSDLRRIRNNESSRKSRLNRRQKFKTQLQMVSELEEEKRRLTLHVKELEELKALIMKHMTESRAKSTSSSS